MSFPASNFCVSSTPPHIQIPEKIGAPRPDSPQSHKMLIQGGPGYPTNLPGSVTDNYLQAYGPDEWLISLTLLNIKGSTEKDRFGQGHCAIQGSIYIYMYIEICIYIYIGETLMIHKQQINMNQSIHVCS